MRWRQRRRSTNVEDRRGQRLRRPAVAVGGGGGILLLVILGALLFGADPAELLRLLGGGQAPPRSDVGHTPMPGSLPAPSDEQVGHHVQNLLGLSGEVQRRRARLRRDALRPPWPP